MQHPFAPLGPLRSNPATPPEVWCAANRIRC